MSGHSGARLTERAYSAGVSDVLRKPLVSRDIAEPLARAGRCTLSFFYDSDTPISAPIA
jgi:FixJ family two-component response regulator